MPDSLPEKLAVVGYISKAHGIRGEVVLVPLADEQSLFRGDLFLRPRAGGLAALFTIEAARAHHGKLLLTLKGISDRTAAERLRSHTALLPRSRLPAPEGGVWLEDLPGLAVTARLEDGSERPVGRIREATAPAGQVLWTIESPDGREILFPAAPDFILTIDIGKGTALIAPPPGLLELYE